MKSEVEKCESNDHPQVPASTENHSSVSYTKHAPHYMSGMAYDTRHPLRQHKQVGDNSCKYRTVNHAATTCVRLIKRRIARRQRWLVPHCPIDSLRQLLTDRVRENVSPTDREFVSTFRDARLTDGRWFIFISVFVFTKPAMQILLKFKQCFLFIKKIRIN